MRNSGGDSTVASSPSGSFLLCGPVAGAVSSISSVVLREVASTSMASFKTYVCLSSPTYVLSAPNPYRLVCVNLAKHMYTVVRNYQAFRDFRGKINVGTTMTSFTASTTPSNSGCWARACVRRASHIDVRRARRQHDDTWTAARSTCYKMLTRSYCSLYNPTAGNRVPRAYLSMFVFRFADCLPRRSPSLLQVRPTPCWKVCLALRAG